MRISLTVRFAAVLAGVLLLSCAAGNFGRGKNALEREQYQQAVDFLRAAVSETPERPDIWRNLGIAYYELGSLDQALRAFKQASLLESGERTGITSLYLGMIHEQRGETESAAHLYRACLAFTDNEELKRELRHRLRWIEEKHLNRLVEEAIAQEQKIEIDNIPPNSAAVIRFDAGNLSAQLQPLGRGIAELIYHDLSYIKDLSLVERLHLARLQQELQLSRSEFADKYNSPRVGKIVGARKIITGTLGQDDKRRISIDCGIIDVGPGITEYPQEREGQLNEIFDMQKQLTFDIIKLLGYEVDDSLRARLGVYPTRSYLALLAYSRGLEYADRGLYSLAEAEFNAAVGEDPNFELAARALARYSGLIDYDGSVSPLGEVAQLVQTEVRTVEIRENDRAEVIDRLQRGISERDNPYTTPQIGGGRVVITGSTDR